MKPSWLNSTVKCDVTKKPCKIRGSFRGIMKEQLQKACLPKISIAGQIVFEILFQLCPDDCTQILVNLTPFTTLSVIREKRD